MTQDTTGTLWSTSGRATALRMVSLALLCLFSLTMKAPGNLLFFVFLAALYFLPSIEAALRSQPNVTSIVLVNVFLGWTLVGWVVAMAWGCKSSTAVAVSVAPPPDISRQTPSPFGNDRVSELEKLSNLKDKGVLTQGEFDREKARILARS